MSGLGHTSRHHRANLAALTRYRPADDPELIEARRLLAIARVEDRIRAAVESAPPLPPDVAARLRQLIVAA